MLHMSISIGYIDTGSQTHAWRKDSEVEEETNIFFIERKRAQLVDGFYYRESLIYCNSKLICTIRKLLLNVMSFPIACNYDNEIIW